MVLTASHGGRTVIAGVPLSWRNQRLFRATREGIVRDRCALLRNHPAPASCTLVNPTRFNRRPTEGFHVVKPLSATDAQDAIDAAHRLSDGAVTDASRLREDLWQRYAAIYPLLTASPVYTHMLDVAARRVGVHLPRSNAIFVDGGAGTGALTLRLIMRYGLGRFAKIYLVEPNRHMLFQAQVMLNNLFGADVVAQKVEFVNCGLEDLQTSEQDISDYIADEVDVLATNLVLPFLPTRERVVSSLAISNGMLRPGGHVVHTVHRKGFNTFWIKLTYLWKLILQEWKWPPTIIRELRANAQTVRAIEEITWAFTGKSESMPSVFPDSEWPTIFSESGIQVEGRPRRVYGKQALVFSGSVAS